jgi:acetyl-CoA C-acetyltransferase
MTGRLRHDRDAFGLVHALGWNFTKHALAVYAGKPPPHGWKRVDTSALQTWVAAQAHPAVAPEPQASGTLETYTVVHGRDGAAERGVAIGLLDDGRRFVAALPRDRAALEAFEADEQVGRRGQIRTTDGLSIFDPS